MSDWDFEPGRPLRVPSTGCSSNAAHTVPDQTFRRARGKFGHTSKGGRGERSAVREVNETTHRRSAALPFRRFFDLRIFGSSSSSVQMQVRTSSVIGKKGSAHISCLGPSSSSSSSSSSFLYRGEPSRSRPCSTLGGRTCRVASPCRRYRTPSDSQRLCSLS